MSKTHLSIDLLLKEYGIDTSNKNLFEEAFTHSSYSYEHGVKSYERLEFLGDAVLQIIISDIIYNDSELDQGDMTKMRSKYVEKSAFHYLCVKSGLVKYIKCGNSIVKLSDKLISDCFESFFGAIYITKGISEASTIYKKHFLPLMKEYTFKVDHKTQLQEIMQPLNKKIEYRDNDSGPAHDKEFRAEVLIDGLRYGIGVGKTKQEAEQNAAKSALEKYVGE